MYDITTSITLLLGAINCLLLPHTIPAACRPPPLNSSVDLPAYVISLPQSSTRRALLEPLLNKHAARVTYVQPFDGRKQQPMVKACTLHLSRTPCPTSSDSFTICAWRWGSCAPTHALQGDLPANTNVEGFQHFSSITLPPSCRATTAVQLAVTMSHLKASCSFCQVALHVCIHAASFSIKYTQGSTGAHVQA